MAGPIPNPLLRVWPYYSRRAVFASPLSAFPFCNKLCGRPPQYAPAPCELTFDLLTSKVVFESRVTCDTFVPILVFTGLSVLELGMYATDRRQTSDAHHRLMPLP